VLLRNSSIGEMSAFTSRLIKLCNPGSISRLTIKIFSPEEDLKGIFPSRERGLPRKFRPGDRPASSQTAHLFGSLSTPYVNHDADLGWVWGMMFFVSPVISSAERGLHVKTERRLVPPCWAAFFCAAAGCNQDDYQRTGKWRRSRRGVSLDVA
jgi:hypothetical protein